MAKHGALHPCDENKLGLQYSFFCFSYFVHIHFMEFRLKIYFINVRIWNFAVQSLKYKLKRYRRKKVFNL